MEEYENLGAFLEHVSLVMDNEAQADEAKVTIMTIHAAKGLEYDTVFLVGWEEGLFPSQRSLDEGGLAVTRGGTPPRLCRDHPRAPPRDRSSTPPTAASTANGRRASPAASSPNCPTRISTAKPACPAAKACGAPTGANAPTRSRMSRAGTGRGPGWQRAAGVDFEQARRQLHQPHLLPRTGPRGRERARAR